MPSQSTAPLVAECEWTRPKQVVWGKTSNTPRGMFVLGDDSIKHYRYSSVVLPVVSWYSNTATQSHVWVREIRDYVQQLSGTSFNTCLLNYYEGGGDYIAYHADKEVAGTNNVVVTVSLGATRRFLLKHITTKHVVETYLNSGDIVIMCGDTQQKYHHSIPKVANSKVSGGRISLTYRYI
jgi:alkylated DNA repair dioxygenase AlkB